MHNPMIKKTNIYVSSAYLSEVFFFEAGERYKVENNDNKRNRKSGEESEEHVKKKVKVKCKVVPVLN
jgi:arabinogalactan endo-1,4-beta-galactosidase